MRGRGHVHSGLIRAVAVVIALVGCGGSAVRRGSLPASSSSTTTTLAPCPATGARVTADGLDASMGNRSINLVLTNCGSTPYPVNGYPALDVLDAQRQHLDVAVLHGGGMGIVDPGPSPLVLAPGEHATAILSWRNTTTDGGAQTAQLVAVVPVPGEAAQVVPIRLDVGTTGQVEVTAWQPRLAAPAPDGIQPDPTIPTTSLPSNGNGVSVDA